MNAATAPFAFLARLSPAGLVRVLARHLRVPPSRSQPETIQALVKVLHDEPVRTWLWIDEAQLLLDDTFAELRTLVEARVEITGLRTDESAPFVAHVAGDARASRFDRQAREVLFERSRGLPGLLAVNLRHVLRARPEGDLDGAQVEAVLQRWELG